MREWIMSASGKVYNHKKAFCEQGFIYWRKVRNFSKGDSVYIYCTKPIGKIMYYAEVEEIDIPFEKVMSDKQYYTEGNSPVKGEYMKLCLKKTYKGRRLDIEHLSRFGFCPPQGPCIIKNPELLEYIMSCFR